MRARLIPATALVAALAAGCSGPPADAGLAADEQLSANLDLALTRADEPAPTVAVASELEAPRPAPARQPPRGPKVTPPAPETPAPIAEPEPEPEIAQTEQPAGDPGFTVTPIPATDAAVIPVGGTMPRSGPSAGTSGEGRGEDDGMDGRRPDRGRGPVIIIRGGVSERDPCAIHIPGRGGFGGPLGPGGVLINERVPRIPGIGNPTFPRGGSPGFGGGFRGGIR